MRPPDLVAAPDFGGVAMENWGLIMFRESALLYEEGVSSITNQEWIATVVAHELAHQVLTLHYSATWRGSYSISLCKPEI